MPELALYGAHGGAGTSTLCRLLAPAWDLGSYGPRRLDTGGRILIVVARNTVPASHRATATINAAGRPVDLLVVVGDGAGPEPREATARFGLLDGHVGGIVRMPFVAGLRRVPDPAAVDLPRRARRALTELRELTVKRRWA